MKQNDGFKITTRLCQQSFPTYLQIIILQQEETLEIANKNKNLNKNFIKIALVLSLKISDDSSLAE